MSCIRKKIKIRHKFLKNHRWRLPNNGRQKRKNLSIPEKRKNATMLETYVKQSDSQRNPTQQMKYRSEQLSGKPKTAIELKRGQANNY